MFQSIQIPHSMKQFGIKLKESGISYVVAEAENALGSTEIALDYRAHIVCQ